MLLQRNEMSRHGGSDFFDVSLSASPSSFPMNRVSYVGNAQTLFSCFGRAETAARIGRVERCGYKHHSKRGLGKSSPRQLRHHLTVLPGECGPIRRVKVYLFQVKSLGILIMIQHSFRGSVGPSAFVSTT